MLRGRGYAAPAHLFSTFSRYRCFNLAQEQGTLHSCPKFKLLAEDNVRTGFFESEQFESMVARLPDELRGIVRFAYITGWRVASEILTLQWRNVDLKGREVRLDAGTTKNRDGRVFPLTDDLRNILDQQRAHTNALEREQGRIIPWVFHRRGEPIKAFRRTWSSACAKAGVPGRIPHDLRRTAVRNMVRRGVPERVAMKLTGHKTRSVFERYNIVSDGDLRAAAEQLSGLTGTKEGQSAPVARRGRL